MENGQARKRWYRDREIEELTHKVVTAKRLRKDRLAEQIFPFHKIGGSIWYDLAEINATIEKARFGGKAA